MDIDRSLLTYGGNTTSAPSASGPLVQTGVVCAVEAPCTLQVRLSSDRFLEDGDLPWCFPLLPPGLLPKRGELVRVFLPDPAQPLRERYWIGPFFTDWQHSIGQSFPGRTYTTSDRNWTQQTGGVRNRAADDSRYPHVEHPERVHQLTRGSSDAVFTSSGAYLRSARHEWGDPNAPNRSNPGLVGVIADVATKKNVGLIRGEVVALLTQGLQAADPLAPTHAEVLAAVAQAHPLAFADVLAEQLEIMRQAIVEHVHPGPGKAGVPGEAFRRLRELDFTKLGNKNLVGN